MKKYCRLKEFTGILNRILKDTPFSSMRKHDVQAKIYPIYEKYKEGEITVGVFTALRILEEAFEQRLEVGYAHFVIDIPDETAEKLVSRVMGTTDVYILWRLAMVEFKRVIIRWRKQYDKLKEQVHPKFFAPVLKYTLPEIAKKYEKFYLRILDRIIFLIKRKEARNTNKMFREWKNFEPTRCYQHPTHPWTPFWDYLNRHGIQLL